MEPENHRSASFQKRSWLEEQYKNGRPPFVGRSLWVKFVTHAQDFLRPILSPTALYARGRRNSLDLTVQRREIKLPALPGEFENFRILFMSDLHLGKDDALTETIIEKIGNLEYDLCLLGGDYRFGMTDPIDPALDAMKRVAASIKAPLGTFAVLGNHDTIAMVPQLEEMGIRVMMNVTVPLERGGQKIYLVGVDDPYFFQNHDLETAFSSVPEGGFSILLAHSPQLFEEAAAYGVKFYLSGHTHNGQIRFPILGVLFKHKEIPRRMFGGMWRHGGVLGYTASGVGTSGFNVRFLCPPEITLLTLLDAG